MTSKLRTDSTVSSAIFRCTLVLSVLIIPQLVQAQWQATAGAESRIGEARRWPFCRMNFGSMPATASVGPFPHMSAIR